MLDRPRRTKCELRKLSELELRRLCRRVPLALEVLVERYEKLVRSIAGKLRPTTHDFDDYVQVGNIGLLKAIEECDPTKTLSSYAQVGIYREIRDYKDETKGPVKRPPDSQDSFKYRWARTGQQAMLLASEATDPQFRSQPDLSFDYEYEGEDDEAGDYYDRYVSDAQSFDRRGHEERIKLDRALETLDRRSRHIIEKRWLINECFDHIRTVSTDPKKKRYVEPGEQERVPAEHEELAAFFGVSRQRIGQLEAAAIERLKAQNPKIDLPSFDPHFVTARWNALTTSPRLQPEWCGIDALEGLWEPKILQRWSKPAIYELGWRWSKPTIVDQGWRHKADDVWNPVPNSARIDPKRNQWPYPRPELCRNEHRRIAYLQFWSPRLDLLSLRNAGDAAKVWRIIRWERGRRAPGEPKLKWAYISPAGHLIPIDFHWPRPWRFPGWYPRPRKSSKSDFVFRRTGWEWIPVEDHNAPEFRGDDGSLMTDSVGETSTFAKGKGGRPVGLSKTDEKILRK